MLEAQRATGTVLHCSNSLLFLKFLLAASLVIVLKEPSLHSDIPQEPRGRIENMPKFIFLFPTALIDRLQVLLVSSFKFPITSFCDISSVSLVDFVPLQMNCEVKKLKLNFK